MDSTGPFPKSKVWTWIRILPEARHFGRVSCPNCVLGHRLDEHISYKTSPSALVSARSKTMNGAHCCSKASRTLQVVVGRPSSTPCTCLLLPHSPFVDLSPAFRSLPPHPRQQLPCMVGVRTDAATGAGSAGKGLGWNQAELLAVARAAPFVLQSSIIGVNQNTSMLGRSLLAEFLRDECCPSVKQQ
jgi:hypothetical protein